MSKSNETKVVAVDIDWDIDDESFDEGHGISLPENIEIPEDVLKAYKENEDAISDYLTNTTGFCHYGFRLVKITEDGKEEDYGD